ncbi:MAG TPA: hypothetical protein VMQ40_05060 [Acidimicrobiales bacterium]|nr:hypothetical protein [Acidimicrobiales bacterium]
MRSTPVVAAAAALLLVALVAGAATLAATSSTASGPLVEHLGVGAGLPRTATGILTFSDSSGISVTASCEFDFIHGTADVVASDSLSILTVTIEGRLVGPGLYLEAASMSSLLGAPWLATNLPAARGKLHDLALLLRHPDLERFASRRVSVTRTPTTATTTIQFDHVRLPSTEGLPITLPRTGRLDVAVTTGTQGQVLSLDATLTSRDGGVNRLDLTITDYDVPVAIDAPLHGSVVALTQTRARALLGANYPATERLLVRLGAKLARGS